MGVGAFFCAGMNGTVLDEKRLQSVLQTKQEQSHDIFTFLDYQCIGNVLIIGQSDQTDGIGSVSYALKKYANIHSALQKSAKQSDFVVVTYSLAWPFLEEGLAELFKETSPHVIKCAISVIEMDAIPSEWVRILNSYFDVVIVPDPYLVSVYKNSGVIKPVFCIPQGILVKEYAPLDAYHASDRKKGKPFTFGISARNFPHKNIFKVMTAFAQEFGRDEKVTLIVHCKEGLIEDPQWLEFKDQYPYVAIKISDESLERVDYLRFMGSLDAYILVSRGEGFSITPREAMTLGVPCILSNNTAQKTICNSGYVYAVECPLKQPCFWLITESYVGNDFDCYVEDVQKAMRAMYENYDEYHKRAQEGMAWAQQYEWKNIMPLYNTFFHPSAIKLSDHDAIEGDCVITSSQDLFEKYQKLQEVVHV